MSHKHLATPALHALAEHYRAALATVEAELDARARSQARMRVMRDHMAAAMAAADAALERIKAGIPAADAITAAAWETGLDPSAVREAVRLRRRRPS